MSVVGGSSSSLLEKGKSRSYDCLQNSEVPSCSYSVPNVVKFREGYLALRKEELIRREIALNHTETVLASSTKSRNHKYATIDQWPSASQPCTPNTIRYYEKLSPFDPVRSSGHDRNEVRLDHKPETTWPHESNRFPNPPPGFGYKPHGAAGTIDLE